MGIPQVVCTHINIHFCVFLIDLISGLIYSNILKTFMESVPVLGTGAYFFIKNSLRAV